MREAAERLIQLYPKEAFTFPHMTRDCRIACLTELLQIHFKLKI